MSTFNPSCRFQCVDLVNGAVAFVNTEDYERVTVYRWFLLGGYAATTIDGRSVMMHHFVLGLTTRLTGFEVHHIDGCKLNNCRWNLQILSSSHHRATYGLKTTNKSGFKGVSWRRARGKYIAQITSDYKTLNLGYYNTKEEAARVYDKKAKELFGVSAYLNFPSE